MTINGRIRYSVACIIGEVESTLSNWHLGQFLDCQNGLNGSLDRSAKRSRSHLGEPFAKVNLIET
ncbi:hypothetical protein SAMN06265222_102494 [Neorhodopirellula lusitana]|uniref:Uncharacterized protein n=1 Tax=Neorhodopirellula lusitana TaxID=445327 RepID=A0ABY1PUV5_9BACT|nr:hypothetical protein SAMN06265222_102494 [Neorhodopirellula lusitana]